MFPVAFRMLNSYMESLFPSRLIFVCHTASLFSNSYNATYLKIAEHCVKCQNYWFPGICCSKDIPFEYPATINQHISTPLGVLSSLHIWNVLMKSLNVFVSYISKISRENPRREFGKWIFKGMWTRNALLGFTLSYYTRKDTSRSVARSALGN